MALIAALALVIGLVVRDNASRSQPTDAADATRTTGTSLTPQKESTPAPSGSNIVSSTTSLLEARPVDAGGFTFQPIQNYRLELTDSSVNMSAPDADAAIGPSFVLIGGTQAQFIKDPEASLSEAFEQFLTFFAQEDSFQIDHQMPVATTNLTGIAADITNKDSASADESVRPFTGRVFMSRPNPPQFFVMVAIAPSDLWEERVAAEYEAVLASISLFDLEIAEGASSAANEGESSNSSSAQLNELTSLTAPASESDSGLSNELNGEPSSDSRNNEKATATNGRLAFADRRQGRSQAVDSTMQAA